MAREHVLGVVAAALLVVACPASNLRAEELQLELVGPDGVADRSRSAEVIAEPLGWASATAKELPDARRFEMRWPGSRSLLLEAGLLWEIRVEADGFWAPSSTVAVVSSEPVLRERRELIPTGLLRGRADSGAETPPAVLELRVRRHDGLDDRRLQERSDDVRSWQQVRCVLEAQEERTDFVCHPPVGRLDLRLSAPGMVPHYLWNVEVEKAVPLAPSIFQFRRGASVAGWVRRSPELHRQARATPVTVRLEPKVARTGAPETEDRIRATGQEATTDAQGFFQLEGAPPGAYDVVASAPGYAPVRLPVRLVEGRETVLRDDVVLRPPVRVELRVEPPLDPYGRAWRWELLRSAPREGLLERVGGGPVSESGTVRLDELVPGPHLLIVEDQGGSRWFGRDVEIDPDRSTLDVILEVLALDGTVLLGDEPLSTRVVFGATDAPTALRFESDKEGRFFGYLPRAGEWNVQVQDPLDGSLLAAEALDVEPQDGIAEVVLRLPDTRVEGQVVDEDGEPVPRSMLITMDAEERRWGSQSRSGDDGRFALRGLEPGNYFLQAQSGSASSDWMPVQVVEDRPVLDLDVVLRERLLLSGRLTSAGMPVPGADVQAVPHRRSLEPQWVERGLTGPDGTFRIELPADTALADLLVSPPGLPFFARRIVLDGSSTRVELEVDPRGGQLVLGGASPQAGEPPRALLLVNEIPVHLEQLRGRWRQGEDGSLVLIEMEPASYALCSVAPASATALASAADLSCARGVLPPLGHLRLDRTASTNPLEVP